MTFSMIFFCSIGYSYFVEKSVTSFKINLNPISFREDVDRTIVISDISSPRRHRVLLTFSTSPVGGLDDSVLIEFALNIKLINERL